jgi:hypothetical protein
VITIVHGNPADVVLGIENVASIWVAVSHVTDVATILAEPVCVNLTVGVETKPAPVMIVVNVSPLYAESGLISLKMGGKAAVVVVVATVMVVCVVTTVVGTGVGAAVGIDETVT